jgi:GPH family glycoside/pentoside/hexuronide:cation symporter
MENNDNEDCFSKLEILSFSGGNFLQEFLSTVFLSWLFFFYETEMGLNSWLITLGYSFYALFNAVNSPILGYYTNQKNRFTERWGRHFPWIVISAVPWFISLFFVYSPLFLKGSTDFLLLIWFTLFICTFSFFFTIFSVNYTSLFPKKFRSEGERREATSIIGIVSFIASGFGSIFPALIIQFNQTLSYSLMGFFSMLIAIGIFFLMLPGIREKRIIKENKSKPKLNFKDFMENFKFSLKQKNFVVLIILIFLNLIILRSVGAAFPYAVRYIFEAPSLTIGIISIFYILGAVLSMPIWKRIGNKINNNKKSFIFSGILVIIAQIFLLFVPNISFSYIVAFIYGSTISGFFVILTIQINADVLDELAAITEERNENIYMGIRGFFVNFSIVAQAFAFTVIHKATGFVEGAEFQTILAQWGIRFTLALLPLICTILGLLIFWKFYDLTTEKVKKNKRRLDELNI